MSDSSLQFEIGSLIAIPEESPRFLSPSAKLLLFLSFVSQESLALSPAFLSAFLKQKVPTF